VILTYAHVIWYSFSQLNLYWAVFEKLGSRNMAVRKFILKKVIRLTYSY